MKINRLFDNCIFREHYDELHYNFNPEAQEVRIVSEKDGRTHAKYQISSTEITITVQIKVFHCISRLQIMYSVVELLK